MISEKYKLLCLFIIWWIVYAVIYLSIVAAGKFGFISAWIPIVCGVFLIVSILFFYLKENGKTEFVLDKPTTLFLLKGILACILLYFFYIVFIGTFSFFEGKITLPLFFWKFSLVRPLVLFLLFTLYFLIGPIAEELIFRGMLQKFLYKKTNAITAILISSVIFSISHFSVDKLLYTFLSGCFYGFLYYKSKKIIIPMICHCIWNLQAYFLLDTLVEITWNVILILFLIIVVFFLLFIGLNRLFKETNSKEIPDR